MGFIEELRRKQHEPPKKSFIDRVIEKIEAERRRRLDLRDSTEREKIARRERNYEEASKRYDASNLPKLIEELKKLGAYKEIGTVNDVQMATIRSWDVGKDRGTYLREMIISKELVGDEWEIRFLYFEVNAEGDIAFKGGLWGSSLVTNSQQNEDKDALEKALGRAYKHPMVRSEGEYSEPVSRG